MTLDEIAKRKRKKPLQIILHTGDTFGFWTVIDPDRYNKHRQRVALCRCVCGKERLVSIVQLVYGKSKSCGCKRHVNMSAAQKEGFQKGQKLMKAIHEEKAVAGLRHTLNKNSTTGHKGVSFMPKYGTYRAYITIHRKQIYLGCFVNLDDAIQARKAAEEKYLSSYREKVEEIKDSF